MFAELLRLVQAEVFILHFRPKPTQVGHLWLPPGWWCERVAQWHRPLGLYSPHWCHPLEVEAVARGAGGADWHPGHSSPAEVIRITAGVDTWRTQGVAVAADVWSGVLGCDPLHVRALYHGCTPWRVLPEEPDWLRGVRSDCCHALADGPDSAGRALRALSEGAQWPKMLHKTQEFFTKVTTRT